MKECLLDAFGCQSLINGVADAGKPQTRQKLVALCQNFCVLLAEFSQECENQHVEVDSTDVPLIVGDVCKALPLGLIIIDLIMIITQLLSGDW